MWTESIKNFAEHGKGNVIFLDGGMDKTMKQMMSMAKLENLKEE